MKLTMQTRLFHVNYLTGARKGSSNLRVSSTSVASVGATVSGATGSNGSSNNPQTRAAWCQARTAAT